MKRRDATPEEREAFRRAFAEARPRHRSGGSPQKTSGKSEAPSTAFDERTSDRLRKGLAEPGARLDLHGYTEAEAHRAVKALLSKSQASGVRVALIVTGRGADESQSAFDLGLAGARRGVLHRLVPRWLREPEFHGLVSAWRPAHRRHGGSGAFYVQIRKLQP